MVSRGFEVITRFSKLSQYILAAALYSCSNILCSKCIKTTIIIHNCDKPIYVQNKMLSVHYNNTLNNG